jgi:MptA/FolE2 family GTP cyclohydrolase
MNAPETIPLPDVQSQPDRRNLPIDAVGIKGIRYPVTIRSGNRLTRTVAALSMTVGLPGSTKGTHMSRFVEVLQGQSEPLDRARFGDLARDMLKKLHARSGAIEMRFPYFVLKSAPVSAVQSLLDYDVCWRVSATHAGDCRFAMRVTVSATSLCPCSKEISEYGAHNQRSHISIDATLSGEMSVEELIDIAECNASCEIFGLLKRPDEKYVTERAYDNPKFVEDLVRDVALALNREPRIAAYTVEAENFESIHNHSAFARIEQPQLRVVGTA